MNNLLLTDRLIDLSFLRDSQLLFFRDVSQDDGTIRKFLYF